MVSNLENLVNPVNLVSDNLFQQPLRSGIFVAKKENYSKPRSGDIKERCHSYGVSELNCAFYYKVTTGTRLKTNQTILE